MQTDRLHALDAVRAYALLLGVVLHAAAAFLADFPMPAWLDQPSAGAALIYYVIHMFRMSAFFLVAGFFARLLVERRGVKAFVKDRARRVALPLLLFGTVAMLAIPLGLVLGALPHGVDYLTSLVQQAQSAAPQPGAPGGGVQLAHLWFLYYLLLFYAIALGVRALMQLVDARGAFANASDRVIAFVMRAVWGPVLIALPVAAYLWQKEDWNEWLGLPAPFSFMPDLTALVGYGIAFGLGWLLNRQVQTLLALQRSWLTYLVLAIALTVYCGMTIGMTPRWQGPNLAGTERLFYTAAYVLALWCWVFAFVGAAVRFLSNPNPVTRYLSDASYWVYLMHLATVLMFVTLLRPFDWHWSIKLTLTVLGSMPILLLTYRYWVRFTWIGAMLNGRRQPRPANLSQAATASPPG